MLQEDEDKQRLVLEHAETASQLSGDITVKAQPVRVGHVDSLSTPERSEHDVSSVEPESARARQDVLLGSVEEGARSELNSASGHLQGHISAELEQKRSLLQRDLSKLRQEVKEAEKNELKATKLQKEAATAKLQAVNSKMKDVAKALEVVESEIFAESEIAKFEHRLVEAMELCEYAPVEVDEVQQKQVRIKGSALVILEADGVVSDLATGLSDELLRMIKGVCEKSGAQVVLASEWRRDVRMVRMLNAVATRIEMAPVQMYTPHLPGSKGEGEGEKEQRRIDEILAFIQSSRASVPWVCLDTLDLVAPGLQRPLHAVNFVKVEASRGLDPSDVHRVLNQMRVQAVRAKRAEGLRAVSQTHADEAELAFAMGTHYRLGQGSAVDTIRADPRGALRGMHTRGGKAPVNLVQRILRRVVHVPQDYASVGEALEACGAVSGRAPYVALRVSVSKGVYVVDKPLTARCRVMIEAERGCVPGDVVFRSVGANAVVSLADESFVRDPLLGRGANHGHVTLHGITIEQGLIDGAQYKANWISNVSETNKHKETRGLYRRMLLDAKIYANAADADDACPSMEAAKERLAQFYLDIAKQQMNKELDMMAQVLPAERWPRAVEALEGSVTLVKCRIHSEAGSAVYAGRTGAMRLEGCELRVCRAAGLVAAEGASIDVLDCIVSECGTFGVVSSGAQVSVKGSTISSCKVAGVGTSNGGLVVVDGCKIASNGEAGLSCEHANSILQATNCTVEKNDGYGITAQKTGQIIARHCSISANRAAGVSAGASGAHVTAEGCTLTQNAGSGAVAGAGGSLHLEHGQISSNKGAGVLADAGGSITISEVLVQANGGHGIMAQRGGQCSVDECTILGNALTGITSTHDKSAVICSGGSVRGSRVGVFATAHGLVRLNYSVEVKDNAEGQEGFSDGGRVERERQAVDPVYARSQNTTDGIKS